MLQGPKRGKGVGRARSWAQGGLLGGPRGPVQAGLAHPGSVGAATGSGLAEGDRKGELHQSHNGRDKELLGRPPTRPSAQVLFEGQCPSAAATPPAGHRLGGPKSYLNNAESGTNPRPLQSLGQPARCHVPPSHLPPAHPATQVSHYLPTTLSVHLYTSTRSFAHPSASPLFDHLSPPPVLPHPSFHSSDQPSTYPCVHPPTRPASIHPSSMHPSIHLPMLLSHRPSIHPSTHLRVPFQCSVYPFICRPSAHPGNHLSVCAPTCPPSGCPRSMKGCNERRTSPGQQRKPWIWNPTNGLRNQRCLSVADTGNPSLLCSNP